MTASKIALGLSAISLTGVVYLWASHDDSTHPIAAVEEYSNPVADLTVQREHPERTYRGTEPRHLEPHPLSPAFPVMPGSPGYINTTPRKYPPTFKTAHIGDEEIKFRVRADGPGTPLTPESKQLLGDYRTLKHCIDAPKPKSDAGMRAAERAIRERMAQTGNRGPNGQLIDVDKMVEMNWQLYEECKTATQEKLNEAIVRLSESTDAGVREAYADAIRESNPEAARVIYEQAWKERGRFHTLGALSYSSLPHEIAYYATQISLDEGQPDEVHTKSLAHWQRLLAEAEARVPPHEFRAASQQAAQILRSPMCCSY